jgi:hypothetical protein
MGDEVRATLEGRRALRLRGSARVSRLSHIAVRNALQEPDRAARVVPNVLFLSVQGGRVMGDDVRATVGSGWPVLLAGMYARAMINTVPEDHAQQTSLIRAICRCTIAYIQRLNRIELSLSTDCLSSFLCSQEGPRLDRSGLKRPSRRPTRPGSRR